MKKLSMTLAAFLIFAGSTISFGARIIIRTKPPKARVEVRTVSPGPNYVWISGHWTWKNSSYVWASGHWTPKPSPKAVWVKGHWKKRHGNWIWVPGHWKK